MFSEEGNASSPAAGHCAVLLAASGPCAVGMTFLGTSLPNDSFVRYQAWKRLMLPSGQVLQFHGVIIWPWVKRKKKTERSTIFNGALMTRHFSSTIFNFQITHYLKDNFELPTTVATLLLSREQFLLQSHSAIHTDFSERRFCESYSRIVFHVCINIYVGNSVEVKPIVLCSYLKSDIIHQRLRRRIQVKC